MRRLLLLAWLALAACSDKAPPQVPVGTAAPPFSAEDREGRQRAFPANFVGQALAVVFWNEACAPCVRELQDIAREHRRTAKPLPILAIHVGQDKTNATALARQLGLDFPLLFDEDGAIARRYGVVGLPTTHFVDSQGIIRAKIVGEADAASFEQQALELLR